jgi:trans-aconitate methyltransferase
MKTSVEHIKSYYDSHVFRKLGDFVDGNARVECALETVESWAPAKPARIAEIGCGIGAVCWRLSQRWPEAEIIGMDISEKSLEIARRIFGSRQISFCAGALEPGKLSGQFDLIVLMDVYEHIDRSERELVHAVLKDLRSPRGRIMLSVPTPRHLQWLQANHPDEIQPIDEHISIETISTLAKETATEVVFYQEVGIWHEGDYAHAVLGKQTDWRPVSRNPRSRKTGLLHFLSGESRRAGHSRAERLRLVQSRLGKEAYPQ